MLDFLDENILAGLPFTQIFFKNYKTVRDMGLEAVIWINKKKYMRCPTFGVWAQISDTEVFLKNITLGV